MLFKKSQGLPFRVIVIAAILLVVLIIIIAIFSRNTSKIATELTECESKGGICLIQSCGGGYSQATLDCKSEHGIRFVCCFETFGDSETKNIMEGELFP